MPTLLPLALLALAVAGGAAPVRAQNVDESASGLGIGRSITAQATLRWRQLPIARQAALQPLAAEWDTLDEAHRRNWLALARNFARMTPDEQAKLHSRMAEWTALSPRQRVRARLNFAEIQRLAPGEERKAQWEAYRALSEEQRKALAERAIAPPGDARRARPLPVRPVPEDRLVPVPRDALRSAHGGPRILLKPPTQAATLPADAFPPAPGTVPSGANAFLPASGEEALPAAVEMTPLPEVPPVPEPAPAEASSASPMEAPPDSPADAPPADAPLSVER